MLVLSASSAAEGTEVPFQLVAGARVGPRAASAHPMFSATLPGLRGCGRGRGRGSAVGRNEEGLLPIKWP